MLLARGHFKFSWNISELFSSPHALPFTWGGIFFPSTLSQYSKVHSSSASQTFPRFVKILFAFPLFLYLSSAVCYLHERRTVQIVSIIVSEDDIENTC